MQERRWDLLHHSPLNAILVQVAVRFTHDHTVKAQDHMKSIGAWFLGFWAMPRAMSDDAYCDTVLKIKDALEKEASVSMERQQM